MISSLTVILLCQLAGEVVARGTGWPIPGPVIGATLLFLGLAARDKVRAPPPERSIETTAKNLLAHLSLLFVPAGVGVVQHLDVLADHGLGLGIALAVSTVLALFTSASTFVVVSRWLGPAQDDHPGADA